jgi:hypothetical protein
MSLLKPPVEVVQGGTGAITAAGALTNLGAVAGAASSTDNAFARFDLATGKIIQNSVITASDTGSILSTSANSGADNIFQMDNSSNTANSRAIVRVSVGGATAGDPFFHTNVSGATDWTFGCDNSDADAFVFSNTGTLGNGNVMRMTTAGEITKPLQPAFLTCLAANTGVVTGDATVYTIAWDTEIFDQNSDISGSTFTAPVTGRYRFELSVLWSGIASAHTVGNMSISTSNRGYLTNQCNPFATAGGTQGSNVISVLADMDAADTCFTTTAVSNGTKVITVSSGGSGDPRSYFSGSLVC